MIAWIFQIDIIPLGKDLLLIFFQSKKVSFISEVPDTKDRWPLHENKSTLFCQLLYQHVQLFCSKLNSVNLTLPLEGKQLRQCFIGTQLTEMSISMFTSFSLIMYFSSIIWIYDFWLFLFDNFLTLLWPKYYSTIKF